MRLLSRDRVFIDRFLDRFLSNAAEGVQLVDLAGE